MQLELITNGFYYNCLNIENYTKASVFCITLTGKQIQNLKSVVLWWISLCKISNLLIYRLLQFLLEVENLIKNNTAIAYEKNSMGNITRKKLM